MTFSIIVMFLTTDFKLNHCFYLSRDCVREGNEGRRSPSFAAPNTAAGLRSPGKQVLLVPHPGEEVTDDTMLFYCLMCHFHWMFFWRCCFFINTVSNVVYIGFFFFSGCCRYRIIIWREVSTLPASQDVCHQQQQLPEKLHTDAGSKSNISFSLHLLEAYNRYET